MSGRTPPQVFLKNEIMRLSRWQGIKGLALNGESCYQGESKGTLLKTYYPQQWIHPGRCVIHEEDFTDIPARLYADEPRCNPPLPVLSYSISPLLVNEM